MSEFNFTPEQPKEEVLARIESYIGGLSLDVASEDKARPWGGFYVIARQSEQAFLQKFFPDLDEQTVYKYGQEIMPKILVVAPKQELSWQYHDRRAEIWRVIDGPVGVVRSDTDELAPVEQYESGALIQHGPGKRHRLVGLKNWGILAEIWQHTNPNQPSDEEDIIRLIDAYGRD